MTKNRVLTSGVLAMAVFTGSVLAIQATDTPSGSEVAVVEASPQYCIAGGKVAIPCDQPRSAEDQKVAIGVGLTIVGCASGAAGGAGPIGCLVGAITALAGVVAGS